MAELCPCSQIDFLRNSITHWNEQPELVDGTGFRVRAVHRSRNVSHIHEYWMERATVGRLSLSLWFVFLTPLSSLPHLLLFFILDCNLLPRTRCTLLKTDFCLLPSFVWVRSFFWAGTAADDVRLCEHHASSSPSSHDINTHTFACTSSKTPSKHCCFTSACAEPGFAQILYWEAFNSVCQKWCQCSHGNYSYTLPHALPQLE